MSLPFLKRSRWWVINEGALYDILKQVEGPAPKGWGPFTADAAMVLLLRDSTVERDGEALGEETE